MAIAGVILAAGLSTRFGSDKLLADLAGRPLIEHVVRSALESDLDVVTAVCRTETAVALKKYEPELEIILNPEPGLGQAGTVKLAVESIGHRVDHILFLLADQPLVDHLLINRFVALAQGSDSLAALTVNNRLLPPSLFGRTYFGQLGRLSGDEGARSIMARYSDRLTAVKTDNDRAGLDVDRPEDLDRIREILAG